MEIQNIFLVLKGHEYYNEVQTMAQVFYPNNKYLRLDNASETGVTVEAALEKDKCAAFVYVSGAVVCSYEKAPVSGDKKHIKNCLKLCIYKALMEHTGQKPQWGILTGIRPAKLARELILEYGSRSRAIADLHRDYLVSAEKAALAADVAEYGINLQKKQGAADRGSVHIYAGIPFCPTTCLYCSFTSYPIEKYNDKAERYLHCLKAEIEALPKVVPRSLYIGGGTPTSLDERRLETLLSIMEAAFKPDGIEYTLEAGRPDTISVQKLRIMRSYGVNRLSINPQTMNGQTLQIIGRRHTPEDIRRSFQMARAEGFCNINMDLIVGLPGETPSMVESTMKQIFALMPDSITVHTLAVKRASALNESISQYELGNSAEIEEMLRITEEYAYKMDMRPYSMYRQKNMAGSFENVGYCKEGKHSLFNIETLEETRTILAVGAGAVTKIVKGDKISRIFNIKNLEQYMDRNDEIIANKSGVKLD